MTGMNNYLIAILLVTSLCACKKDYPLVEFKTAQGSFIVEVYTDKAPVTAGNFLKYVRENRYKDAEFYRVVTMDNQPENDIKIEVIQGGLWEDEHPDRLPPIKHETTRETGILHKNGVISMARNRPGTASDAFFICIGDQPELDYGGKRNPDGQGFAAFGKVIKGMDVVKIIQQQNAENQYLQPHIPLKIKAVE